MRTRFFQYLVLLQTIGWAGGQAAAGAVSHRLAVAWNDPATGGGFLRAMKAEAPWSFVTEPLPVGRHSVLKYALGRLYAVSPVAGSVAVVSPDSWTLDRVYALGPDSAPLDIAVVNDHTAYVTRRMATHLLRLDLASGATTEVVDLSIFADDDGVPDLGMMALHGQRLFVQIRRLNSIDPRGAVPPPYLAVIDLATESILDIDPAMAGNQAIRLAGTFPKTKMQVMPETARLFVGATGGILDAGGIEMIDLEVLRSLGLVLQEADGKTGVDLGPFCLVSPERGYLVYTTEITISSHLHGFSLAGGVDPVERHTGLDFIAPTLEFDPANHLLFFPGNEEGKAVVIVFDAATGHALQTNIVASADLPTDLLLFCDSPPEPEPASLQIGYYAGLQLTGPVGSTHRIEEASTLPSTNWTTLTNITLVNSPYLWFDPQSVTLCGRRFYRAVAVE